MHAFDVTQVVDRCEHHVGLALKAGTGHQVVEGGPPFGQFCAANGLRRRLNSGFACHAQAVQNRGPSALFLEFSNAFFNQAYGTGAFELVGVWLQTSQVVLQLINVPMFIFYWATGVGLE